MSNPSHSAASRISAMWKAHKEREADTKAWNDFQMKEIEPLAEAACNCIEALSGYVDFGPDRGIEARRIRSLPPLNKLQQAD